MQLFLKRHISELLRSLFNIIDISDLYIELLLMNLRLGVSDGRMKKVVHFTFFVHGGKFGAQGLVKGGRRISVAEALVEVRVLDLDDILELLEHSRFFFDTEQVVNLRRLFDSEVVWDGAVEITRQRSDHMRFLVRENKSLQLVKNLVTSNQLILIKLSKRQFADIKAEFTHLFLHSFKAKDVFHKFLEATVK